MEPDVSSGVQGSRILLRVTEGMAVHDVDGDEIGVVDSLYFGSTEETPERRGQGPATAGSPPEGDDTILDEFAQAFRSDEGMPEVVRDRLLRQGFMRVDMSGLFSGMGYAAADQVAAVSDDGVHLNIRRDELIHRS